jgi:putative nucleotidyltransferase with HDIG domain
VASGRIVLVGISQVVKGLHWEASDLLRIGRRPNLEIVVPDPSVSQQHAEVRVTPRGWMVHDLGTAGNTLVNGIPVNKVPRNLQKDDVLQCGNVAFKIGDMELATPALSRRSAVPGDIKTTGALLRVQALSQLSWEQGLQEVSLEKVGVAHAKHFLTLLRAGYHLSRIDSLNELLQSLLDDTVAVLDAQRGAIVLAENQAGELSLRTLSGPKSGAGRRNFSGTLVQRCFSKGESILCVDPQQVDPASAGSMIQEDMTSVICALLRSPRRRLGVLHLDRGPAQPPFTPDDFKLADAIAVTVSVGIESAIAVAKQRDESLQEAVALARLALEARCTDVSRHCDRVAAYALVLADELGMQSKERRLLETGALLHDLGMIAVEDAALKMTAKRGIEDIEMVRRHTIQGEEIARAVAELAPVLPMIRNHHESWDGNGHPDGLKGAATPLFARLVAVADAFDELTSGESGARALSPQQALADINAQAGRRFDPDVVNALLRAGAKLEAEWAKQRQTVLSITG